MLISTELMFQKISRSYNNIELKAKLESLLKTFRLAVQHLGWGLREPENVPPLFFTSNGHLVLCNMYPPGNSK